MQEDHHSISMAGSKYSWEDVDKDARKTSMNRSQFFQHLYTTFKEKKKRIDIRIAEILLLLLMAITLLVLVIRW